MTKPYRLRRGAEEVDKQFVDAFSLVVMHPVRCVREALDAIEVGYVVAVGLGQFGAEVGIALPQMTSVGAEIGRSFAVASFWDCLTDAR